MRHPVDQSNIPLRELHSRHMATKKRAVAGVFAVLELSLQLDNLA
jgi:hypothetical protein